VAEDALTVALTAVPKVTGDITAATSTLDGLVVTLEAVTAPLALAAAITDGNAALVLSVAAKTAFVDAGGGDGGLEIAAVETAETDLDTAISGEDTATIVAATIDLNTAVDDLVVLTGCIDTYDMVRPLREGWTLISTDKWIDSETSAWEGTATLKYKYTGVAFVSADFADLMPVEALYVKMPAGGWAGLNYSDLAPGMSAKELVEGWNLISSGVEADAGAVLSPLQGSLTTLVSQDAYNVTSENWYIDASTWGAVTRAMNPFDGYWIYMNEA
ncbi:unnamed protein product, partial [marine sediment metagenome]